MTGKGVNTK